LNKEHACVSYQLAAFRANGESPAISIRANRPDLDHGELPALIDAPVTGSRDVQEDGLAFSLAWNLAF